MAVDLAYGQLLLDSIEGVVTVTDAVGPGEKLLALGRCRRLISIKGFDDVYSVMAKAAKGGTLFCDDGLPRAMGNLILGTGGEDDVIDHGERVALGALWARVFKPPVPTHSRW